jgi:peroxiredoxin
MKRLVLSLCVIGRLAFAVTPFELPWMNASQPGTTYKSSDHADGIFVVEAYFRTCPYCNDNAPNVDALAESFANEARVQVLDVGIDRRDSDYKAWIREHNPNHPVLKDGSKELIGQLGTTGYPSTYVMDCQGNVVFQSSGSWSGSTESQIKNAVESLLKQDCHQ